MTLTQSIDETRAVNMSSPPKKQLKVAKSPNILKRSGTERESSEIKRIKVEKENDIRTLKRKNFVAACEQVSYKEYCDFESRLQLIYLPGCLNEKECCHQENSQVKILNYIANV